MVDERMEELTWRIIAGQTVSLIAFALCVIGFASKSDGRLFRLLISANVAFAAHFILFESWTAAALTAIIVVRVSLANRFKGSWRMMSALLLVSVIAAALTWQRPLDALPLTAAVLGTVGMFMLHGIAMRFFLAGAALAWTLNNLAIGSIGGTLAEALILATNLVTIVRMSLDGSSTATEPQRKVS